MPWKIMELPKLPAAEVMERFEKDGWEVFQLMHYEPSGKVYVYLRRSIVVPGDEKLYTSKGGPLVGIPGGRGKAH